MVLAYRYYNVKGPSESIESHLKTRLLDALNTLNDHKLLRFDESLAVEPLVGGRVMSKSMVTFDTMKHLISLGPDTTLESTLWAICQCEEVCP